MKIIAFVSFGIENKEKLSRKFVQIDRLTELVEF